MKRSNRYDRSLGTAAMYLYGLAQQVEQGRRGIKRRKITQFGHKCHEERQHAVRVLSQAIPRSRAVAIVNRLLDILHPVFFGNWEVRWEETAEWKEALRIMQTPLPRKWDYYD